MNTITTAGCTKNMNIRLPDRFHFGKEEETAVSAVFARATATGNPPCYNGIEEAAFCKEFAELLGGKYADGVNSGTNALFVALKALDLPPFSEVIVSCITDPGGMMPIVINNCIPIPADTAPGSFNVGAEQIKARITKRTSAIVVAHIGGEPADMPAIMKVSRDYNLPVIEDCSQAHFARIDARNVGNFGRYGIFSLMFSKHICSGGQGGMVISNTTEDYWKARRAADRGKPFGLQQGMTNCIPALSCNMDEIHAAIGRAQLRKLPEIVARRRKAVTQLYERFLNKSRAVSIPVLKNGFKHCYWWWRLKFNAENMKCSKGEFCAALAAEGVKINSSYAYAQPARQDWYKRRVETHPWNNPCYLGNSKEEFPTPNCEQAIQDCFILVIYESFGPKEIEMIARAFEKVEKCFAK